MHRSFLIPLLPALLLAFLPAMLPAAPAPGPGGPAQAAAPGPVAEDFAGPAGLPPGRWRQITFGQLPPTSYRQVHEDGRTALRAEADMAASCLVWEREFDPHRLPGLAWEWKITRTVPGGDVERKEREDLPARVLVLFPFDAERASLWERLVHTLLRLRYGTEPPGEALVYVWANHASVGPWRTSTYTPRVRILALESGDARAGRWVMAMRDIAADYQAAFQRPAPRRARIAVMVDTDDTGDHIVTWFDSFRLAPRESTPIADRR